MRASVTAPRSVALALVLGVALAASSAASATASAPRLVVASPAKGSYVTGRFPVRAHLAVSKRSRVRSARFYLGGKLIKTDRRAPFAITSKSFDSSTLRTGKGALEFKVTVSVKRRGRIVKRVLERAVHVTVFRPPTDAEPLPADSWTPAFADNFDSASTSASLWNTQRDDWIKGGRPYSNLEGAGYLPSNIGVSNGAMSISTANISASGYPLSTGSVNTHKKFSFQYGYLEARVIVPSCAGCWPAFWLLPSDDKWPPEIDIFEFFNTQGGDKQPWSSLHWPAANAAGEAFRNDLLAPGNYVGAWHTYGMLWGPQQIQFFIDGVPGPSFTAQIPHEQMYPVLQLAIQSGHRPAAGSTMQIDYVRAWSPVG